MNTYPWIIATDVSNSIKILSTKDADKNVKGFRLKSCPKRQINTWPAIMLAVSRIIRVSGRINELIDSMITIKGTRAVGVPVGTRCAIKCLVFSDIIFNVIVIQIGRDRYNVVDMCLVGVKIKGISLIRFII